MDELWLCYPIQYHFPVYNRNGQRYWKRDGQLLYKPCYPNNPSFRYNTVGRIGYVHGEHIWWVPTLHGIRLALVLGQLDRRRDIRQRFHS